MTQEDEKMVDVVLSRIVIRDRSDRQYICLREEGPEPDQARAFPIVIGMGEAQEIQRVVAGEEAPRPLTHRLLHDTIQALGARLRSVDIVDLRQNTYFANLVLENEDGQSLAVVDARPSDAIAIALRARARIRVAESVLDRASDGEQAGPTA